MIIGQTVRGACGMMKEMRSAVERRQDGFSEDDMPQYRRQFLRRLWAYASPKARRSLFVSQRQVGLEQLLQHALAYGADLLGNNAAVLE
jgi:hypothetical protein